MPTPEEQARLNAEAVARALRDQEDSAKGIYDSLLGVTATLSRQQTGMKEIRHAFGGFLADVKKLKDEEEGVNTLNKKQLENLKERIKARKSEIRSATELINANTDFLKITDKINEEVVKSGRSFDTVLSSMKDIYRLSNAEVEAISLANHGTAEFLEMQAKALALTDARLEEEDRIIKAIGLSGTMLKGVSGLLTKMGMDSTVVGEGMNKANDAMREAGKTGTRWETVMAGINALTKSIASNLSDPLIIITAIGKAVLHANENVTAFEQNFGMAWGTAFGINFQIATMAAGMEDTFITSDRLRKSLFTISEQLGFNALTLGGPMLVSMTNFTEKLGMGVEDATSLATIFRLSAKDTEATTAAVVDQVSAYNDINGTAINSKGILKDIAGTSRAIVMNLDKNPKAIAAANLEARKYGVTLSQIEGIASHLLDFESSINAELEARLLSGQNLNLAHARELAMTGDMKGLGKEIFTQEAIINAFRTKNLIVQKSIASSIGMSTEDLAKQAMQYDLMNMSLDEATKKWGKSSYEQLKAVTAQTALTNLLESFKSILGDIAVILEPVAHGVAVLLSHKWAAWAAVAVASILMVKTSLIGLLSKFTLFSKLTSFFGGTRGGAAGSGSAPSGESPVVKVLKGLQSINFSQLAGAALVIAAIGAAFVGMGYGLSLMEKLDWTQIAAGLGGFTTVMLATLIPLAALTKTGVLLAAALGIAAVGAAFVGMGFGLKLAGEGIKAMGDGTGFMNVISSVLQIGLSDIAKVAGMAIALASLAGSIALVNAAGPVDISTQSGSSKGINTGSPVGTDASNAAVIAKMNELISAVRETRDIYLDGKVLWQSIDNRPRQGRPVGTYK